MSGFFYNLGRQLGRKAVPAIRKSKWIYDGLAGTEEEALRAEAALGRDLAVELRETLPPCQDPALQPAAAEVVSRLATCLRDRSRSFHLDTFHEATPNAMALPGGYLFLSDSLAEFCGGQPEELAFVLGHEMAHIVRKHTWDRLINGTALRVASALATRMGVLGTWLRQEGLSLLSTAHANNSEFDADSLGFRLAAAAGFGEDGGIAFLERIGRQQPREALGRYINSHPSPRERIDRLQRLRDSRRQISG